MKPIALLESVDRLENATALDAVATPVRKAVKAVIRPQWLRDVLHGVPMGHPLHPAAAQIPLGTWASAAVLDAVPGTEHASAVLVATGVASAGPTAIAGWTDWSELHVQQQRVGVVHAAANLLAVGLYSVSLAYRCAGRHGAGKAFGYAGFSVGMIGGFLGGHLAQRQASGANHAESVPHLVKSGWHRIASLDELPDGQLTRRVLGDVPLLVYRRGEVVQVLSDECSHLSGPLHQGKLLDGADPCVVCPWHQSTFSLRTGEVRHGPATAPQPHFVTRIADGAVEVSLPGSG